MALKFDKSKSRKTKKTKDEIEDEDEEVLDNEELEEDELEDEDLDDEDDSDEDSDEDDDEEEDSDEDDSEDDEDLDEDSDDEDDDEDSDEDDEDEEEEVEVEEYKPKPKKKVVKKKAVKKTAVKKSSKKPVKKAAKETSEETPKKSSGGKKSKKASFLKTGKARAALVEKEEVKAKQRQETFGKMWRFFISRKRLDEDFMVTFLDGDLDDDGFLDTPVFYEHNIKMGGRWEQFVSCQDDEADPLQEEGKEPYLAQAFTIIDHNAQEEADDDGKIYPPKRKLLVAKRKTQKQLQKLASRRGGLKGCTFIVSRTSDKDTNVGNQWDFHEKVSMKDLKKELISQGIKKEDAAEMVKPADYTEELTYYSAEELEKMGVVDKQSKISQKDAYDEDEDEIDDDM